MDASGFCLHFGSTFLSFLNVPKYKLYLITALVVLNFILACFNNYILACFNNYISFVKEHSDVFDTVDPHP